MTGLSTSSFSPDGQRPASWGRGRRGMQHHRDASKVAVRFLQAGGGCVWWCVIQSHVMMRSAPPNEDHPLPEGSCPRWVLRTRCEGVRPIYPDLVWRGNMSTSPRCWTETDTLPPAEANLRRNNQRTQFI